MVDVSMPVGSVVQSTLGFVSGSLSNVDAWADLPIDRFLEGRTELIAPNGELLAVGAVSSIQIVPELASSSAALVVVPTMGLFHLHRRRQRG